jgi:hypothetical protein
MDDVPTLNAAAAEETEDGPPQMPRRRYPWHCQKGADDGSAGAEVCCLLLVGYYSVSGGAHGA